MWAAGGAGGWQECSDCGGTDIVHGTSEGETVCRGCGLVLEARMYGESWEGGRVEIDDACRFETLSLPRGAHPAYKAQVPASPSPPASPASPASPLRPPAPTTRPPTSSSSPARHSLCLKELASAERALRAMCERTGLKDNVLDSAIEVFVEAAGRPGWKSRKAATLSGLFAACVYHACNAERVHRTPLEIARQLDIDFKTFKNMIKHTQSAYLEVADRVGRHSAPAVVLVTRDMIPRYVSQLRFLTHTEAGALASRCRGVLERVRNSINNHKPETVAAGLLLHCLTEERDKSSRAPAYRTMEAEVASVCGVSVSTTRLIAAVVKEELGSA